MCVHAVVLKIQSLLRFSYLSVYALYDVLFLRHQVGEWFLRKTVILMTLMTSDHKKEFISLFLNIVLVNSQIMWLTCSKMSFFSEKYVTVSS